MTQPGNQDRFERICLIGMGGHARGKLLPAVLANGQQVAGLVSSQDPAAFPGQRVFSSLGDALATLASDVLMVIATPPAMHADQVVACAAAGFDVLVEKPAFVTLAETLAAQAASERADTLVIEGFMHRHSTLYARLMADWPRLRARLERISLRFVIPQMPQDTYRSGSDLACSTIYDIGCYPLSLLLDLGFDVDGLSVVEVLFPGDPAREAIRLEGVLDGVPTEVEVGVAETYSNTVSLYLDGNEERHFAPFFYGRGGDRELVTTVTGESFVETVHEGVAFERMLGFSRETWRADQPGRWEAMATASRSLERLAAEVAICRAQAGRRS